MNQRTTIGIAIAIGLAWLWSRFRPLTATVTTSEYYDTDDYLSGSTTYPESIQNFARAIARAEGFGINGAIPTICNNPGNLKLGEPTLGTSGITIFDTPDYGWQRLYKQLALIVNGGSDYYYLDMSIEEMGNTWEADPGNAWARNVADYLAVTPEAKLWQVLV